MGFLGDLWDGLTGAGAAKAANQQTALSKEMVQWQKELFEKYGAPLSDMMLRQAQTQQPANDYMQGLIQTMLGMPAGVQLPGNGGQEPGGSGGTLPSQPAQQPQQPTTHQQNLSAGKRVARILNKGGKKVIVYTDGTTAPFTGTPSKTGIQTTRAAVPASEQSGDKFERVGERDNTPGTGDYPRLGTGVNPLSNQELPWWMQPDDTQLPDAYQTDLSGMPNLPGTDWASMLPQILGFDPNSVPESWQLSDDISGRLSNTPDYQDIESQVKRAYDILGSSSLDQMKQQRQGALESSMARRGLSGSSMDVSGQVGLENWADRTRTEMGAQGLLASLAAGQGIRQEGAQNALSLAGLQQQQSSGLMDRYLTQQDLAAKNRNEQTGQLGLKRDWQQGDYSNAMQRYLTQNTLGEGNYDRSMQNSLMRNQLNTQKKEMAGNNFWNMQNLAKGGTAQLGSLSGSMTPWASVFGNMGGNAANLAGMYGNQASQSMGLLGQALGTLFGQKKN
jgi:hypothetical protein